MMFVIPLFQQEYTVDTDCKIFMHWADAASYKRMQRKNVVLQNRWSSVEIDVPRGTKFKVTSMNISMSNIRVKITFNPNDAYDKIQGWVDMRHFFETVSVDPL